MKKAIIIGMAMLIAGSLLAADAGAKGEVLGAIKKLHDKGNYSWTATSDGGGGGGGQRRGGPTNGKTDGTVSIVSMARGDNPSLETVIKGDKVAIKTPEGWQTPNEMASAGDGGGQGNRGRMMGRMFQNYKAPAGQAEEIVGKVKDLKKTGDVYEGELTEEGAKSLLTFGGRGGGAGRNAPEVSNAKGSVKFWTKDGVLSKYEINVQGHVSAGGNDRDVNRTTTVDIKDVGTTKVEVPEEAKKKLS